MSRMFGNRVLGGGGRGVRRKLHFEKLHDLYSSSRTVRAIK
jgi:hypothetical protein